MQKTTRGSILIWALFLSLFIVFAFVSISTKVNRSIKDAYSLGEIIDDLLLIPSYLQDVSYDEQVLSEEDFIQVDKTNIFGLKKGEKLEIRFSSTTLGDISLNIIEGSPVFYKFFLYNSGTFSGSVVSSGTVATGDTFSINFNATDNSGILYIENLGGYSKFSYTSNITSTNPKTRYRVMKKIGGKYFEKSVYEKLNFIQGDSGVDYARYEMNF